jgi:prepilin-type N-terminal cleavage/methylation domain-containing protein
MYIKNKGFTLIELSIVIVIIGLIVAGVVGGQALVKQANLRSVISDMNKFQVAVNTFKLEYNAIPGDFSRATNYWGGVTVDGNGDKRVLWQGGNRDEAFKFWQHLSLSEILPEEYSGTQEYNPGRTFPNGPLKNSGYYFHVSFGTVSEGLFNANEHVLFFGGHTSAVFGASFNPIITSKDAISINTKIDDGKPYSGKMRVRGWDARNCAIGTFSFPANTDQVNQNSFNLSLGGNICNIAYNLQI